MNAQQIQQQLENFHYWDARVLRLDSEYFGDEVTLVFEDSGGDVNIKFSGCSKVFFATSVEDREKPLRELALSQIPYFIQDIDISDCVLEGKNLLNCKVSLPPLNIEINCNSVSLVKG